MVWNLIYTLSKNPPMRPTPPSFPDPALNAPDSEARAARGTTTDSTSDPRA